MEFMGEIRVRFAPSPTGHLHVGGARTTLYNWLFARGRGGRFILRIEDTDLARSTGEAVEGIVRSLRWLGLDWDEGPGVGGPYGPYFQSQRIELYREYARKLLELGRAYRCYCSPEELEPRRKAALERGGPAKYDRRCLSLSEAARTRFEAEGRPAVTRFLSRDEGTTVVDDRIRGEVRFENSVLDDFVMIRSDGLPTYNFAVVVDDALMRITHVIRGEDHISNTPRQIQVYEALGLEEPEFAHIPMILGPDRTRLSKRHGATSVGQFEEEGFLPEAMVNYLALLGWGYDATQQIFSVSELIEKFSLERVSKNAAVFDMKKLEWMNGYYIREMKTEELAERVRPFLEERGLLAAPGAGNAGSDAAGVGRTYLSPSEPGAGGDDEGGETAGDAGGEGGRPPRSAGTPCHGTSSEAGRESKEAILLRALELVKTRMKTLPEVVQWTYYHFTDEIEFDPAARERFLERDYIPELFGFLVERFADIPTFNERSIEAVFEEAKDTFGLKLGDAIQPVRVAVTGGTASPGMYEVLALLGRERTIGRLGKALGKTF